MERKPEITAVIGEAAEFLRDHGQYPSPIALVGALAAQLVELRKHVELCEDLIEILSNE